MLLRTLKNIRLHEEKLDRIGKCNEAKEKWKAEREQTKLEKDLECKRGGAKTRGEITQLTNTETNKNLWW